jgi:eukaryotic translation initiation factor 2C
MVPPGQIMRKQIPPNKTNDVLEFSKKRPDERFGTIQRGTQVAFFFLFVSSFGWQIN